MVYLCVKMNFFKKLIRQVAVYIDFNPAIVTNILKKKIYTHVISLLHHLPKNT